MPTNYRPLKPGPSGSSSSQKGKKREDPEQQPDVVQYRRANLTLIACGECRIKKVKCDGQRPKCGRCVEMNIPCVYSSQVRDSPVQKLHRANERLRTQLDASKALFRELQTGSEDVKAEILARMAADEEPDDVLRLVNKEKKLFQTHHSSPQRSSAGQSDGPADGADGTDGADGVDGVDGVDEVDGVDGESETPSGSEQLQQPPSPVTTALSSFTHSQATTFQNKVEKVTTPHPASPSWRRRPPATDEAPWEVERWHFLLESSLEGQTSNHTYSAAAQHLRVPSSLTLFPEEDHHESTPSATILSNPKSRHVPLKRKRLPSYSSSPNELPPGSVTYFGNLPLSSAVQAAYYPPPVQARQLLNFQTHEHTIPSFAVPDGSLMSNLFFTYRDAAREMIANGAPVARVLGREGQYDVELFFRERIEGDDYNVESWACEILKRLEGYDIFVLLAGCALYTAFMRWNVLPTASNYSAMPAMIRPSRHQRFTPHNMTIDLNPHPAIRTALLLRYRDWLLSGTTDKADTSIDWPYSMQAAVTTDPITGRRVLTDAFVEHGTNPDNWSLKTSIRRLYPEIEALGFKLRDEG